MDVRILCELLEKNGFDSADILAGSKLSPSVLTRPNAVVTRRQEREFHTLFATATRNHPEIWVESARRNNCSAWGDYGMANITAPTLRHIRRLAETYGGGTGRYPLVQQDRSFAGVAIAYDLDFAPGAPGLLYGVVRDTISGVDLYNELWGSKFPFAYIQVPAEAAVFGLSAYIDVPIRYSDGPLVFVWPIELDEVRLPRGDELLHRHYLIELDRAGTRSLVELGTDEHITEILAHITDTSSGIDEVAAELGVSRRTLQRRLAERGVDFRGLRATARLRKAQWMLRTSDASVSEIASSVGYFEVSSFSHAFRRWVGESPRDYRRRVVAIDVQRAAA